MSRGTISANEAWKARKKEVREAWEAVKATPEYKAKEEAEKTLQATPEYKNWEEAREQGSPIRKHTRGRWEACKEYFEG